MDELIGKTAEFAVIGAVLRYADDDLLSQVLATTEIDYFETPACRAVREVLSALEGKPYDPSVIKLKLQEIDKLNDPVTPEFLEEVIKHAPLPVTVPEHVQALRTYHAQRKVFNETNNLLQGIRSNKGNASELSGLIDDSISNLGDMMLNIGTHDWVTIGESVTDLINKDHTGPSEFISTGINSIDEVLNGGLGLGQMITVAARPGFGKSSLALDMVRAAITEGTPTALFSMEMSKEENTARLLGSASLINHQAIRKGEYTAKEKDSLIYWNDKFNNAPLYLDTRSDLTLNDLFATYFRMNADAKSKYNQEIKLVVIDYLQLLQSNRKFPSRQEEIAYYSRSIKAFSKKNSVAVITIAQLNRGGKNSDVDHRPDVKDLRESGAIEQDSDVVLLLAKPEEDVIETSIGKMLLIVGKNRNGDTKDIPLSFMAHYPRFEEREDDLDSSDSIEAW